MTTTQGHVIKYKTDSGEWVAIPLAVLDVYDSYVKYCESVNAIPVTKQTYYEALGNLQTYVKNLQFNEQAVQSLEAIASKLQNGVLPVGLGGTGIGASDENAFITYLTSKIVPKLLDAEGSDLQQYVYDVASEKVNTAAGDKLDVSALVYGTEDPDKNTALANNAKAKYYFQIKA